LLTVFILCSLIATVFLLTVKKANSVLQKDVASEFWLLSDIHFLSSELHDNGEAFRTFTEGAAGKEITYQTESIEAFVDLALEKQPTGVILTGDMTLNGEKVSAKDLAKLLKPLQKASIMVLGLPGNHEINNGWARYFEGDKEYYADQISPQDFKDIFSEGYEKAISKDNSSLSYSINLNSQYRLILVDSCIYEEQTNWNQPNTNGRLKESTLEWLQEQLEATQTQKQVPLLFMHHNLLTHNSLLKKGYVLDNSAQLKELLTEYQVPLVFSGHIHIQDIAKDASGIQEVVTGSYSTEELNYGVVTLTNKAVTYQKKTIDLDQWAAKNKATDSNLLNYSSYQEKIFKQDTIAMTRKQLASIEELSEEQIDKLCDFVAKMNIALFTGNDDYSPEEKTAIRQSEEYQLLTTYSYFLKQYVDSMLEDTSPDNELTNPL
jgi:3',5'-cyclic AMP phosphodiesterase CpdA